MQQLVCSGLTVGYEGKPVAPPLDFAVEKGDYVCILGENGAGKSTLMKTLLRLQPPLAGKMYFEGMRGSEIGYLPQQTQTQRDFPASVREVVLSGCLNGCGWRPFYSRAQKQRAAEAMRMMRVDGLAARCYRELSGGQQQRVLLARALCASHKMLLLDEPVAGLDVVATKEMYALIERLNAEQGITVLMVSHDVEAAVQYANKVLFVGKEIFFGSKQAFLQQGVAGRAFGGGYEHL